jgi:hypothetical protein
VNQYEEGTMTYDEITPPMRRFIGTREAFRKIGFSAENLYCMTAKSVLFAGALCGFMRLKTQGKTFDVELGPVTSEDAFAAEYERICEAVNAGRVSASDLARMLEECEAYHAGASLLVAIENKGIRLPRETS